MLRPYYGLRRTTVKSIATSHRAAVQSIVATIRVEPPCNPSRYPIAPPRNPPRPIAPPRTTPRIRAIIPSTPRRFRDLLQRPQHLHRRPRPRVAARRRRDGRDEIAVLLIDPPAVAREGREGRALAAAVRPRRV